MAAEEVEHSEPKRERKKVARDESDGPGAQDGGDETGRAVGAKPVTKYGPFPAYR